MNPEKLYDVQLSVSKLINDDLVNDLISRLSIIGNSSYNYNTKCIDIKVNKNSDKNDDTIKTILKEWLFDINLDSNTYNILSNNIDFLFNITKTNNFNNSKHIIHLYLY